MIDDKPEGAASSGSGNTSPTTNPLHVIIETAAPPEEDDEWVFGITEVGCTTIQPPRREGHVAGMERFKEALVDTATAGTREFRTARGNSVAHFGSKTVHARTVCGQRMTLFTLRC
eukprot:16416-Amphidinium_carterae.3